MGHWPPSKRARTAGRGGGNRWLRTKCRMRDWRQRAIPCESRTCRAENRFEPHRDQERAEQSGAAQAKRQLSPIGRIGLHNLGKAFDSVIDSGLFHVLSDTERPIFVTNLAAVLSSEGTYFMLCFSDLEPGTYGSRRVTQSEIRGSFERPWRINYIKSAQKEARHRPNGIRALLSSISKE